MDYQLRRSFDHKLRRSLAPGCFFEFSHVPGGLRLDACSYTRFVYGKSRHDDFYSLNRLRLPKLSIICSISNRKDQASVSSAVAEVMYCSSYLAAIPYFAVHLIKAKAPDSFNPGNETQLIRFIGK